MTTKKELIDDLALRTEHTKAVVAEIIEALADSAGAFLRATGEFEIYGVVKLTAVDRPARTGRNPANGDPVEIAAKRAVKAKPAAHLRTLA